ncbi:MAG: tyrosine-type recombinase/integrase [Gammaproteobacteria bacterium]|nr:tyrosine-type recombinase/integrase [Gammaproteobacteria bacterium]
MRYPVFKSHFGQEMTAFCALHRLSGTDYLSQARLLSKFDDFLDGIDYSGSSLTRQVIDRFMQKQSHLAPRSRANRLCVVRQFCVYLNRQEPTCYVPERSRTLQSYAVFHPYIFSTGQVLNLMAQAMALPPAGSLRGFTLKTVYGLLFTTGLRINEALSLNLEDIHFNGLRLFIRRGKFRKERWVTITPSTAKAIQAYLNCRLRKFPASHADPLFVNRHGKRLSQASARKPFRKLLASCGMTPQSGRHPRLQDLRHSFAVERLLRWYREREDVNSLLPALATYMGHVNIASTQIYIHATPELMHEVYRRSLAYVATHIHMQGGTDDC